MAADLKDIMDGQSASVDAIVSEFTSQLGSIIEVARKAVMDELISRLSMSSDIVDRTAANSRILNKIGDIWRKKMDDAGYQELLGTYVDTFDGQFIHFDEVIQYINRQLESPLPAIEFDRGAKAEFAAAKESAKGLLNDIVSRTADVARRQSLQSMGALPAKQLATIVEKQFGASLAESEGIADTAVSSFYRTITDNGFQAIEQDLPGFNIQYAYEGPLDKLNRPFCRKLESRTRDGKTWTREQINKMNNGQMANVFVSGGGYRCRHQWMISIKDLKKDQKEKGQPDATGKRSRSKESYRKEIAQRRASAQTSVRGGSSPTDQLRAHRDASLANLRERRKNAQ